MFTVADNGGFKDLIYIGTGVLPEGTVVYHLSGRIVDRPTQTSIQIDDDKHVEDALGQYINHSCDPNVRVVGEYLVAIKEIQSGDSITFDYNETEDSMSHPFTCHCCGKLVRGCKFLFE